MGDHVISAAEDLVKKAMRGVYPIESEELSRIVNPNLPASFASPVELYHAVDEMIAQLQAKLTLVERALRERAK